MRGAEGRQPYRDDARHDEQRGGRDDRSSDRQAKFHTTARRPSRDAANASGLPITTPKAATTNPSLVSRTKFSICSRTIGFWKLFDRMRWEGRLWNHNRVHRVYCAQRQSSAPDDTACVEAHWPATDGGTGAQSDLGDGFMTETLYDARRVRLLTVIDEGNREGLDVVVVARMR